MMRRSTLPVLLALAAALPAGAQVQDSVRADTTVYRVPGIAVSATRPVTTVGGSSALEISVEDLRLPPSPTTADVLRELPALHLRTNSRGEAEVSVRGSESRQVAILVDGIPLTLGWDARTDVSVLPAGAVTRVEFTRGLASMLQGPNVLGGVVEMSLGSDRFGVEPSLSAGVGVDDRGGYSTSALVERPIEDLFGLGGRATMRSGVGYSDSPGFPLPGGVREEIETDGLRLNTDAENLSGFFALRWEGDASDAGPGPWGSVSASTFQAERGIGAELGVREPRLWRYPEIRRTMVAISGGTGFHETPWGRGDLEISVGVDDGSDRIESYATRAYREVDGVEEGDDRTATLRMTGDHTLGERGHLAAAFTHARIRHDARIDGVEERYAQHLTSLAAETRWQLLAEPAGPVEALRLSLGGAWDRGSTPRTGGRPALGTMDEWGGRIGLSALTNDGRTMVHAGVSRRARFPSLRESYSEALNRFIPNPDLLPERLVAVEAGVTTQVGEGELQVVAFRQDLRGAIRRITFADGMRQRVNAGELESRGIEVLANQAFGAWRLGGDLTLQSVALLDPVSTTSTRPENLPERSGRIWLERAIGAGFELRGEATWTGAQYCQSPDTGADVELDGGTWTSAVLSRVWGDRSGRRIETSISAENLGDVALYDQCGLPRAGRLLRMQLRVF